MEFLKRHGRKLIVFGLLATLWWMVRIPETPLESIAQLDARIAAGRPLVLEFFANT